MTYMDPNSLLYDLPEFEVELFAMEKDELSTINVSQAVNDKDPLNYFKKIKVTKKMAQSEMEGMKTIFQQQALSKYRTQKIQ